MINESTLGLHNVRSTIAQENKTENKKEADDTFAEKVALINKIEEKKKETELLDVAFKEMSTRRKNILQALKKQKMIADLNKKIALSAIDKHKARLREEEPTEAEKNNDSFEFDSTKRINQLKAHSKLIEDSNQRIREKIKALTDLGTHKSILNVDVRRNKQEDKITLNPETELLKNPSNLHERVTQKLQLALESPVLDLSEAEKKKAFEWLDLKRNSVITQKTDQKIAEKLKLKKEKLLLDGFDLPDYVYDYDYYADIPDYDYGPGPQFLNAVSHILEDAEHNLDHGLRPHITLAGSLRHALLKEVSDHAKAELHSLPGGGVRTKPGIHGHIVPPPVRFPAPQLPPPTALKSKPNKSLKSNISFSQIMGDLLQGESLKS